MFVMPHGSGKMLLGLVVCFSACNIWVEYKKVPAVLSYSFVC
jgi:hypothetical protein